MRSNDIISYPNDIHISFNSPTNVALAGVTVITFFFYRIIFIKANVDVGSRMIETLTHSEVTSCQEFSLSEAGRQYLH